MVVLVHVGWALVCNTRLGKEGYNLSKCIFHYHEFPNMFVGICGRLKYVCSWDLVFEVIMLG